VHQREDTVAGRKPSIKMGTAMKRVLVLGCPVGMRVAVVVETEQDL